MLLRFLFSFLPILLSFATVASERVSLTQRGGVYSVPVQINGTLTIDFLLDTGASDVIIPVDVALTLVRTGTIDSTDFLGSAQYTLADGSIVENTKINFRTLQIGSRVLHNVRGAVGGVESTLLLGQTALERLEPWRLDTRSGHLVFMNQDETESGYARNTAPSPQRKQRRVASVADAPVPLGQEPRKVLLSGWKADRNAALTRPHTPGSEDGLGVNFPLDGEGARIVACTDAPAVRGRSTVGLKINIDGSEVAAGTAHAAPRSRTCWNAYLPKESLRAIKEGSTMWVSVAERVFFRADLTGSAKAMNEAWEYVEARLPEDH